MSANNNYDQQLARLNAKIAKRTSKPANSGPPKKTTVDAMKATGEFIDAMQFKWRGALNRNNVVVIAKPVLHPLVEKIVCTESALYIHHANQVTPQVVNIRWHDPTGKHPRQRFLCACGRGAYHLYPIDVSIGGGYGRRYYGCRHCATAMIGCRYKSYSKSYGVNRTRVRASTANGYHPGRARDPNSGRFVKETPLPAGMVLHPF
jgi:hypothetical protein